MIIVFPMLVSRAVSENSIPGISKSLENWLIIHNQDLIINSMNESPQGKRLGRLFKTKKGFVLKEEFSTLSEALPPGAKPSGDKKTTTASAPSKKEDPQKQWHDDRKKKQNKQKYKEDEDGEEDNPDKRKWENEKRAAAKASAKLQVNDMKSISLEPTYMNIEKSDKYGNKTTEFLGIKVIPVRVKSDVKLSHLILQDAKLGTIQAGLISFGRKWLRWFYRLFDKWTQKYRILGGLTASGDPRRDIIMGRTGMKPKSETFLVLSKQEDIDDYFLNNINRINRLFKMGWGNFIVTDDIARSAYFCMKSFRGMCNVIPYAMMYQYLGQSKAYESMEDAKKANSSIFKIGPRFSKLVGEWKVEQKLGKYSHLNEDIKK